MGHKVLLHELLKQDQEPFHLQDFISYHRTQLKSTTTISTTEKKTSIQHKKQKQKQKPIFCIKDVCLFSYQDSPDSKKSPYINFTTNKSPCNNIAAMLLEAASRVQNPNPKPGSRTNIRFGLLSSILRRFRAKTRELGPVEVKPISPVIKRSRKKSVSSGEWSEKSSEVCTSSCSSRSVHDSEECFCSNPSSPFRFSLQRSPSVSRRKMEGLSPVGSPSRHFRQDKESCEGDCSQEIHRQEDEEKEQCSPVSVLDPLFDDDDEEERDGGTMEEDGYDVDCPYASVQRAKHQLLLKLQRFERLAGLDPINLEKHMLEQHYLDDEYEDDDDSENVKADEEEVTNEELFKEIMNHLGVGKVPWYMKKLVIDLIIEENRSEEHQVVVQRVCKRLHSWKVVELNTIDMMVEKDFRNEGWKSYDKEMIRETGIDIEAAIFGFLVDELAQELVNSSWQ
ncbi:hypothetical protein CTI12_AA187100 [Artemisia annua]|uniref:Uncharacterized protein n=1 Tax=Artemisia annua TaxID=35608 RepID=A0A2U1P583_ARTAN|nr:hypothetical protein CTI12_AA187100 [Artemisia annua]